MKGVIPEFPELIISRVRVQAFPKRQTTGDPFITIEMNDIIEFQSECGTVEKDKKDNYKADIPVFGRVQGDVKICLQLKKRSAKQILCHFWFNSGFITDYRLELPKLEIDVANKDKNCKIFAEDFQITIFFKDYDEEDLRESKMKKKKEKN